MSPLRTKNPFVINMFKPAGITSYDVIRRSKKELKQFGKIGHFGTLDPFAEGVLMLGVDGAQKLNDYIHSFLPKTYLAKGVLGIQTETGDPDGKMIQTDDNPYLQEVVSQFSKDFIEDKIREKFLGKYLQSPHKYSAAKFEGKPLHQWAREGVEIKKEQVQREVYSLEVVQYEFPDLWIRFSVSSGTYIRTLFADCANHLGTIGHLKGLIRESVGSCRLENCLSLEQLQQGFDKIKPQDLLAFGQVELAQKQAKLFANGVQLRSEQCLNLAPGKIPNLFWVYSDQLLLGLTEIVEDKLHLRINFCL